VELSQAIPSALSELWKHLDVQREVVPLASSVLANQCLVHWHLRQSLTCCQQQRLMFPALTRQSVMTRAQLRSL